MNPLSKEFELAVACCRWPRSSAQYAAIARAAETIDWSLFQRVAHRHRVEGLVWDGLRHAELDVPREAEATLSRTAGDIIRQNLLIVGESLALHQKMKAAKVDLLFIKGVTLGMLAYGNVSLKRGWDIDLIVPREQVEVAVRLLRDAGYRCNIPRTDGSGGSLVKWHAHAKESVWQHESKGFFVELHTALVDNDRLLPGLDAHAPSQEVELAPGRSLPTLARDELVAYLFVHGASSGWFRLKWIADLAALLSNNSAEENDRLYRRSQQLGAGRSAAQALLLAEHLFETRITPELKAELESDALNRWLFSSALELMAGRHVAVELHERRLGTLPIHLMQFALLPGWRFKLSELARQLAHIGG